MTFPTYTFAALLILCAPPAFAQSTYSRDFNGNIVQKDQFGNTLGTTSRDFNGNLVQKDQFGNIQGRSSQDFNGILGMSGFSPGSYLVGGD